MFVRCACLSPLTLVAGLLVPGMLLSAIAPQAAAQAAKPATPNAALLKQLRATRALLHQANHDYQGHRVQAIREITRAIHALQPPAKKPHPPMTVKKTQPKPAGTTPATTGHEPQAVSDAQLRQAMQQLQTVQSQLGSATTGNITAANAAVGRAIHQLQTALRIN